MSNILISWYSGTLILVAIVQKLYFLNGVGDLTVVCFINTTIISKLNLEKQML